MIDAEKQWLENRMTSAQALRWLIEFGTGWVDVRTLFDTWVDKEINWHNNTKIHGLLEEKHDTLRLTQKAIALIKEVGNE